MKIGDKVKLCHDDDEVEAFISGEDEDGRSAGKWIVTCPEKEIINAVFHKESFTQDNKYYNFGNFDYWITSYYD